MHRFLSLNRLLQSIDAQKYDVSEYIEYNGTNRINSQNVQKYDGTKNAYEDKMRKNLPAQKYLCSQKFTTIYYSTFEFVLLKKHV